MYSLSFLFRHAAQLSIQIYGVLHPTRECGTTLCIVFPCSPILILLCKDGFISRNTSRLSHHFRKHHPTWLRTGITGILVKCVLLTLDVFRSIRKLETGSQVSCAEQVNSYALVSATLSLSGSQDNLSAGLYSPSTIYTPLEYVTKWTIRHTHKHIYIYTYIGVHLETCEPLKP